MKKMYRDLWKEKEYCKYLCANLITRIGDGIDMIAFSWLVYEISGSTVLVATIHGVNMIPNLTIGFIAGGISKYINEKHIMWLCDFGRAICVMLIAFFYLINQLEVWHLFVMMFLISTFEAIRSPAQISVFPKIIGSERREAGLALQESLVGCANLIGLICGPICIGLFGLGGAIIIDATSFLLCGGIILSLKHIKKTETNDALTFKSYMKDIKAGFVYAKKDHLLVNICIFGCLVNVMFVPLSVFQTPYIKDVLHMGSEGLAVAGIGEILGMIITAPLIPKVKKKISYQAMVIWGGMFIGVGTIWYALLASFAQPLSYIMLGIATFLIGAMFTFVNFPIQMAMYGRVSQEYLGRFASLMKSLNMSAIPFASFVFGAISNYVSIIDIILMSGIGVLIAFGLQFLNKTLKQLNQF